MKISDIDKANELLRNIYFEFFKELFPNITRKGFDELIDNMQQMIKDLEKGN